MPKKIIPSLTAGHISSCSGQIQLLDFVAKNDKNTGSTRNLATKGEKERRGGATEEQGESKKR